MTYGLDKLKADLQDFDFNDVFDHQNCYDKPQDSPRFGDKSPKKLKDADGTSFSYSHYSAYTERPMAGKLQRTKSEILKPKHVRSKCGNLKTG